MDGPAVGEEGILQRVDGFGLDIGAALEASGLHWFLPVAATAA